MSRAMQQRYTQCGSNGNLLTMRHMFIIGLLIFAMILAFEMLWLPSNRRFSGTPLSVNLPAEADSQASTTMRGHTVWSSKGRAEQASHSFGPPAISVIIPCFGHVEFLEQALSSIIQQDYPPAEIIIVDDGSPEQCGTAAKELLLEQFASGRRQNVQQLKAWWGLGDDLLQYYRDEVIRTPNRGVAHARNAGIRRSRGDWICCMDGDDTVSASYFMEAMAHVAQNPDTNLVYANQQFFGESRWQWHVPDLRRLEMALVNGPLPLMTLFRRVLWEATPHGFDETLPKGHEDWAFWLQLTRVALRPHKIDSFLTQYRYKKNSKMRNRERANPEIPRLLRTLFPDLFPVRTLLLDHRQLLKPNGFSEAVRMDVSVSHHLHPNRAAPHLWRGMILQAKHDFAAAANAYTISKSRAAPFDWQPSFRLWKLLAEHGDAAAAEREKEHLYAMWGAAQFAWYSTDAWGEVLNFSTSAPAGSAG